MKFYSSFSRFDRIHLTRWDCIRLFFGRTILSHTTPYSDKRRKQGSCQLASIHEIPKEETEKRTLTIPHSL